FNPWLNPESNWLTGVGLWYRLMLFRACTASIALDIFPRLQSLHLFFPRPRCKRCSALWTVNKALFNPRRPVISIMAFLAPSPHLLHPLPADWAEGGEGDFKGRNSPF